MSAPDDYDRDRLHKTWGETHKESPHARREANHRTQQKRANRMPGHFGKANWEAYQHYELYNMIMKADPRQMYERAQSWKTLAGDIETTTADVQGVVEQVMTSWQGQAAVNAGTATSRLMQWAGTASHTASTVAANMSSYSDAVSTAQRHMPPPAFSTAEQRFRDGYTVMTTGGPADAVFLKQLTSDGLVGQQEAHARKAEAVSVMEQYESHSRSIHQEMPHFADAEATTKDSPTWTPSGANPGGAGAGGGSGSTSPGFPGAGGSTSTLPAPDGNTSTGAAGFVDPAFAGTGGGPGGSNGFPGSTGFGGGPGSLNGSGADALRGGSGFGSGVGGFGGAGAGGAGAGGVGPGALMGRGAGGVVGGPGGGLLGGGAGARGGAGGFGGMPMGHGANGEEDGEHTNKYDEGLDLFDDLPPAYPPVFGA
jgi:uncharacterized protein YukE